MDVLGQVFFLCLWIGFCTLMYVRPDLQRGRIGISDEEDPVGAAGARVLVAFYGIVGTLVMLVFIVRSALR